MNVCKIYNNLCFSFFRFFLHCSFRFYCWENEFETAINADFFNLSKNFMFEAVRIQRYWVCLHIFFIYVLKNVHHQ